MPALFCNGTMKTTRGHHLANAFCVPGIHRPRRSHRYRGPRHVSVIKAAIDGIRPGTIPPSAWDEVPRAADRIRSWKRHRNRQFLEGRV